MRKIVILLWILVCLAAGAAAQETSQGSLFARGNEGKDLGACPLKTTAVTSDISGYVARVNVRQVFENSFAVPIEAVYVFPLGADSAVDKMTMTVGTRVIRGGIMERAAARETYTAAKNSGQTASLLDQERPNIFTQSVANIMPGETVVIEISYVEMLKYEDGEYEFVFPMTVAPRYNPASVTDAERVTPPIAEKRAGHDISITVNVNSGVPIEAIRSTSHDIEQTNLSPATAKVTLRDEKVIPNKDFILRYDVTGKKIEDAIMTHRDPRGGFFTMILQPPDKLASEDRTPKEIVFVLDTSGSMSGFPIEKAKEAIMLSLDGLYPEDTFDLITFAGDTAILFGHPVPATKANLDAAKKFLAGRRGSGGTEMMKAIKAALEPSDAADHLRIVCFMTDGEIGNDDEIVAEVQRHPNARVFSFGIGESVNRSLLDRIASEGKGEAEYVTLESESAKAARRFYQRVRSPILTDLSVEWNGLPVTDVYPTRLTDLFSAKPVVLYGRYSKPASGTIKLRGKIAGQPYEREIAVDLPDAEPANDVLSTLWARTRIADLTSEELQAKPDRSADLNKQILDIGINYSLMTKFTSFVAVEDGVRNPQGQPARVDVPVEAPDGTQGSGTGQGSGSGSGNASNVVVSGSSLSVDPTETKLQTNVTAKLVSSLPKGTTFSTLLKAAPNVKPAALSGGFQIDGASGTENTWVIDGQEVTAFRTGTLNGQNDRAPALIYGKAEFMAIPTLPNAPNGTRLTGSVSVAIEIGVDGAVANATALSGRPEFRDPAIEAARASRFEPAVFEGEPVGVKATIEYSFEQDGSVKAEIKDAKAVPPTAIERRRLARDKKLHFWLFALLPGSKASGLTSEAKAAFVRDGKADVSVTMSSTGSDALRRLASVGFEIVSKKGRVIEGRIPIDKIGPLADIDDVKLVLPKMTQPN